MRALSSEEADMLRVILSRSRSGQIMNDDENRVAVRLETRGCIVGVEDYRGVILARVTDLGRLALRVAVAIPAVQP